MEQWVAVLLLLFVASVHGSAYHRVVNNNRRLVVRAVFNQGGVLGEVTFSQEQPGAAVDIEVNLEGLDQFTDNYGWSVHEFPIRSSLMRNFPCSNAQVGKIYDPGATTGGALPNCLGSPAMCAVGDFSSKHGPLIFNMMTQCFEDPNLSLFGSQSIIGRSLVIDRQDGPPGAFICANIEQNAQQGGRVETLRASFDNDIIQGDVIIRAPTGRYEVTVEADIYRVDGMMLGGQMYSWSLNHGPANSTCAGVGRLYGSASYVAEEFACSMNRQRECAIGNLTSKCGPLEFENNRAHLFCTDSQLGTINIEQLRQTVRISDGSADLGCASLELVNPRSAIAKFREGKVDGSFQFYQDGPDDRTYVRANLRGLSTRNAPFSLRIFEGMGSSSDPCNTALLGNIYSQPGGAVTQAFRPIAMGGILTNDYCAIGNLDSILPINGMNPSLSGTVSSSFLPLFGPYSVINRTLALVGRNGIITCGPIECQACQFGPLNSLLGYQNLNYPPL